MEENKRKRIEAQLREMFATEDQSKNDSQPAKEKLCGVRVIRRRKGSPDRQIV